MKPKAVWVAWVFCGLVCMAMILNVIRELSKPSPSAYSFWLIATYLAGGLMPVMFAFVGALITAKQPRNVIGWLLLVPAATLAFTPLMQSYIESFATPPQHPGVIFMLILFVGGASWLLFIFPTLLIILLFPTGRPPSPRWRWVIFFALGMASFLILFSAFSPDLTWEGVVTWAIPNPIGFLHNVPFEPFFTPWILGLVLLTILCVASPIVRYRRANPVEREQIKWVMYACGFFGVVYVAEAVFHDRLSPDLLSVLLFASMATIPVAIAIAILRYRLWDIDIIIRRTLVYGALTLTLALVYFGSVILLQSLVTALGGRQSAVVTVVSTLLIAALFTPLRRRIQSDIDRRFYRKKYDAEKTIAAFSAALSQEVDMEQIGDRLLVVVEETMQPEQVSLWLREVKRQKKA